MATRCLSKRKAFFTQIMNSGHQTNFLGKLLGLLAESEEEIVGDVYGDLRHNSLFFVSVSVDSSPYRDVFLTKKPQFFNILQDNGPCEVGEH